MNLPAGLIFYLDFQYGTAQGGKTINESLYGASEDLKRTSGSFDTGLYGAGAYGYSSKRLTKSFDGIGTVISATVYLTSSAAITATDIVCTDTVFSASNATKLSTGLINRITVLGSHLTNFDVDGVKSFTISDSAGHIDNVFPQFTRTNSNGNVEFVVEVGAIANFAALATASVDYSAGPDNLDDRGDFEDTTTGNAANSALVIPEINVSMKSDTVAAKTRKLKAQWTPEFAQDLNAYHSIDAEAELTSILSEYISMEIDLEILDMLIQNADTIEGWSAKVGRDITVGGLAAANTTAGGTDDATFTNSDGTNGVYYTKMSWFQTLGVKLQKVSNIIHQKTLRGGANWMVISPKVSTILESIPGFAADSAGDADKYAMGVQKVGSINSRYTVYKNPYMTENCILMGYKGSQFLETGAVFAPYIPLIMTPLVYDPTSFTPRKGIMTRYAKKMVRPDFYGKVMISNLDSI
jgi:hypothetical protein